jgi:hypothetical protein
MGAANSYLQNELKIQTSEAFIDLAAIRLMLNGSPRAICGWFDSDR